MPPFPSAAARYCTADHKRTPIDAFLRQFQPSGTGICAIGIRAEESRARSHKPIFRFRESVTKRDRTVFDWHPLFNFRTEDVWAALNVTPDRLRHVRERVRDIRALGGAVEKAVSETLWRWHPAYALGNERLSCSICILASRNDLLNGIEFHPDYYRQLVQLEQVSGFTFRKGLSLAGLRPDLLTEDLCATGNGANPPQASAHQVSQPAHHSQPVQLCFEDLFNQVERQGRILPC